MALGGSSYMAPEMVILPKQPRSVRVGYSNVRGSGVAYYGSTVR